jgi:hypothetical protein
VLITHAGEGALSCGRTRGLTYQKVRCTPPR